MLILKDVLNYYKTKTAIAKVLNVSKQAVSQWPEDGPIPENHELRLRYEINPEVFGQNSVA